MNVSNIIRRHVAEQPDKTAIIFDDRHISYSELDNLINRTGKGLIDLGLKRGEVLSIFLPSLPELIIGYLGSVRAGVTVNVVNAMLKEQEVSYILRDCDTRAVLTDSKRLPIIESVRSEVESLTEVIVLEDHDRGDYPSFRSMLGEERDDLAPAETKGSDLCHLMYTSGTTGWPKGVMATHLNVWHNSTEFGKIHFTRQDTIMVATPIFHCWGLINGTFGMLSRGGTVITVERFYPDQA
jgi:long-chain acyl-CoA synthetase